MDLKETILEGTIGIFNEKGLKFTMDDIAESLKISKKTIYKVFQNKEELFLAMVDYMLIPSRPASGKCLKMKS